MAGDLVPGGFGELLRDHRRAAGLTQEELAERAGVSPRSISEMERGGAHVPRRDTVSLLARGLGLSGQVRDDFEAAVARRPRVRPSVARAGQVRLEQLQADALAAVERRMHNVPRSLTSFVGREEELRNLTGMLQLAPLLTLVGAGGVGKTRLAQELVRQESASYADGCWIVELAGLADASLVSDAVAAAVGLRDFQARSTLDSLAEYLRGKHLLLVFDNCEHLVDPTARLVAHLLALCPWLRILATSREPLGVPGETTLQILPLELPDPREVLTAERVSRSAAVRLFMERARAANNALTITDENAPAIARICIAVAGIPLALELAAARTHLLTVEELADRLDRDTAMLVGTNRLGLPQHRTIRATLDWSHDLLGAQEQVLLRRLSVFAGGFSLQMTEEVCSDAGIEPSDVVNVLGMLVDKSMVLAQTHEAAARFRLLEPVRQYAMERLDAAGETSAYRARHAGAVLRMILADQAGGAGPDEVATLDRLEIEFDNIRLALRWALANQDTRQALRCSAALFRFWERRGHFQEGCAWLEQALAGAQDAPAVERCWALNALAFLYWRGGDAIRALPIAEQALAASREGGTARDVGQALLNLGMIAYFRNEPELAVARLEESVQLIREGGYVPQLSLALTFLARIRLWVSGPDDPRVIAAIEESLRLAQAVGSRYAMGHALVTRGDLAWRQGDVDQTLPLWRQATQVRFELGERRGVAGCLARLAMILATRHRFLPAAWLFGAAYAQHAELGPGLHHDEEIGHAHLLAETRRQLGAGFEGAWHAGRTARVDDAVARALEDTRHLPEVAPV